ncbi:hypothetical protein M758_UG328300 [Ceratodon purpureus]|nr:hypothetical protein M758_UG328300 [Ceratodon purpureus]
MKLYVNVAQIHYENNDHQFIKVENVVRQSFVFDPPLKENWFPDYMRKRLEKYRSMFRKHFEETGQRHPQCEENQHPALLAWWASPGGSNKSQRMRQMNASRAQQRVAMQTGGSQIHRLALMPLPHNGQDGGPPSMPNNDISVSDSQRLEDERQNSDDEAVNEEINIDTDTLGGVIPSENECADNSLSQFDDYTSEQVPTHPRTCVEEVDGVLLPTSTTDKIASVTEHVNVVAEAVEDDVYNESLSTGELATTKPCFCSFC